MNRRQAIVTYCEQCRGDQKAVRWCDRAGCLLYLWRAGKPTKSGKEAGEQARAVKGVCSSCGEFALSSCDPACVFLDFRTGKRIPVKR